MYNGGRMRLGGKKRNMFQILVIEDDKNSAKLMTAVLRRAGYEVHCAGDGMQAFGILDTHHIDFVVLDVMLPGMYGFEFTENMRKNNNDTPIIMVTAKQLSEDKLHGFLSGTDDYMVKPVNEDELLLRIKAILRRAKIADEQRLCVGDVVFDYNSLSYTKNGETITMPKKEFQLIYELLSYPNKIFTRLQLMDEIWGMESNTVEKTVDVHINRLRKRFEEMDEIEIVSVRGVGYKAVLHVGKTDEKENIKGHK